ncbi:MAG: ABC transporter ATP-binding protein [Planctomycetota bacterium]|nr:ABC transporter ATP-binding protein [Planctomycetota bacterium]
MLRVQDVTKRFGRHLAVDRASFEVGQGEVVGLLGPNGAGKTTIIRMITGTVPPDAGAVSVHGLDSMAQSRQVRGLIGYMPESAPLYGEMRVDSYLRHRGKLFGMARSDLAGALRRELDRCMISDVARSRIATLSKGYRQRVALAAALLHQPKVLILDEPTNALDPAQVRQTRALIREVARTTTLLLSSHVLSEVERVCDRVVVLAAGRIRADMPLAMLAGTGERVFNVEARQEAHPSSAASESLDAGALEQALSRDAGARALERHDLAQNWTRWRLGVPSVSATDPRETIARVLARAGWLARELSEERPSLERAFERLTSGGDAPSESVARGEAASGGAA